MTILNLTYPNQNNGCSTTEMDRNRQLIYCPDCDIADSLSRGLCADGAPASSSGPDSDTAVHVTVSGYGEVKAEVEGGASIVPAMTMTADRTSTSLHYVKLAELMHDEPDEDGNRAVQDVVSLMDTGHPDRNLDAAQARLVQVTETLGRSRRPGTPMGDIPTRRRSLERERERAENAWNASKAPAEKVYASRMLMEQSACRCISMCEAEAVSSA